MAFVFAGERAFGGRLSGHFKSHTLSAFVSQQCFPLRVGLW
jgi:hypothetical protein